MHNFKEIEKIFQKSLTLEKQERELYLKEACHNEPSIQAQIEEMIEDFDEASQYFQNLQSVILGDTELPGESVGFYKIEAFLGEGGMGKVYLAHRADGLYDQKVAIKILKSEAGKSRSNPALERQILANLNHPSIAKIFNAGYTDKREPYLVMEYIEGKALDDYCKSAMLSIKEKVQVFIEICEAVQYAHQNLVIHRDLKPSNIIVNDKGEFKLLDFGIALLQDDKKDTLYQPVLTPNFCAPEQLKAEQTLTVATDIYQLGLLLFRLLAGKNAFDLSEDSLENRKAIIENEPAPSLFEFGVKRNALSVDLNQIIQKALQKKPADRYRTVEGLKGDLEAALQEHPLRKIPNSAAVKLRKFISRNRYKTAVFLSALIMLAAFATVYTVNINKERKLALEEYRKAEEVKNFLITVLRSNDPTVVNPDTVTLLSVLSEAQATIAESYEGQPLLKNELYELLYDIYTKRGNSKAMKAILEQQDSVVDGGSPTQQARWLINKASLMSNTGKVAGKDSVGILIKQAFDEIKSVPFSVSYELTARAYNSLGLQAAKAEKFKEADSLYAEAILIYKRYAAPDELLLTFLSNVADLQMSTKQYSKATKTYDSVITLAKEILPPQHPQVFTLYNNLAGVYYEQENFDSAFYYFSLANEAHEKRLGPAHPIVIFEKNNLAAVSLKMGEQATAEKYYRFVLQHAPEVLGEEHMIVAFASTGLSRILTGEEEYAEAEKLLTHALNILPSQSWLHGLSQSAMAILYYQTGREKQAQRLHEEAYEKVKAQRGPDDMYTRRVLEAWEERGAGA